ncbi:MAG: SDR family oxidoreductase [Bryobacterales bacterium]|nr:SDR family oxidoreductase [Bryobacterales bacterium]
MDGVRPLANQVALVTGSSKGIGQAIAMAFARHGAVVAVCGRDSGRVEDTVSRIREEGGDAHPFVGGLASRADCDALTGAVMGRLGQIDILVNNAGEVKMEPFLEFRAETWQQHLDVHMSAALYCSQAAARDMATRKSGRIIHISSIAAAMGGPGFTAYGAVKAALESLTRVMSVELAPLGIAVNAVAPGPVMNDMMVHLYGEQALRERALTIPAGRLATREEVAHAALFFALPASGYITGQVLGVDGGAKAAGCYTAGIYQKRKAAET